MLTHSLGAGLYSGGASQIPSRSLDNVDGVIDQMRDAAPGLIVFDTMNDYFDRWADTNKGRDVTQALQPFKRMASELDAAVVLIRHLTKSPGKAMYRGQRQSNIEKDGVK